MIGLTSYRGHLMALDPIHVGTGAFRLGRVDLPIQREPGTNLPKIPGTTLNGMARAYAARLKNGIANASSPHCSGQGNHCGTCAVCYTFGTVKGNTGGAYAGTANLFDARLLFFPVATMCGPVWLTSPSALENSGFGCSGSPNGKALFTRADWGGKPLNLGWLLVETETAAALTAPQTAPEWTAIQDRVAVVEDAVLQQAVNSNLEVRTSVSIDQTTGAARDTGLFTYEAIPRGAWMTFDVNIDDYRGSFPAIDGGWQNPGDVVKGGLAAAEQLGLGGMGTRGFGRMRLVGWQQTL